MTYKVGVLRRGRLHPFWRDGLDEHLDYLVGVRAAGEAPRRLDDDLLELPLVVIDGTVFPGKIHFYP